MRAEKSKALLHADELYTMSRDPNEDQPELDRLHLLVTLYRDIGQIVAGQVAQMRRSNETWVTIGEGLGVSKQAAQQRFGGDPAKVRHALDSILTDPLF
jgi:hypothetical protein